MARMLVLCMQPMHLPAVEGERWLRQEIADLTAAEGIGAVHVLPVCPAARRGTRQWDWLIEVEVTQEPEHVLRRGSPTAAMVGDLRLLGMRPSVVLVADEPSEAA